MRFVDFNLLKYLEKKQITEASQEALRKRLASYEERFKIENRRRAVTEEFLNRSYDL